MLNLKDKNLYYVGGVVRDEILGIKSFDIDLCYEGDAIKFAKKNGLNITKENPDFGTVRVVIDGKEVDIASTREETYPKAGHLPVVKNIGCDLKDDLKRRDFTVNAMAKNTVSGEIVDFFGGMEDIKNKKLRVLHDNSFIDDPTRIIRGLKFSIRFNFNLEEHTQSLQKDYLQNVNRDMSYHRLRKELFETFNLNLGEAFDEFLNQKMYKLLSDNVKQYNIKGEKIQAEIIRNNIENPFIIYMACLGISDFRIELTRQEKRILMWVEKLQTQMANNNTPKESIVVCELLKGELC